MIKHTPQLVDAVEMAQQSPHTFHLPNLKGLKVGDIVKVCNGFKPEPETFYVRRSVRIARQQVKNSREFSGYVKMFEC